MKLDDKKLSVALHDIVKLITILKKKKLKDLALRLEEIREEIVFAISEDKEEK
jgi:hypothetical protein